VIENGGMMSKEIIPSELLVSRILVIRSQKVMIDTDLAAVYGVPVKRLNEQVRRNIKRFPEDFCFQLTAEEWESVSSLRSQFATLNGGRGKHRKYLPYAFTEHGAMHFKCCHCEEE
jgi:hypothetical protein